MILDREEEAKKDFQRDQGYGGDPYGGPAGYGGGYGGMEMQQQQPPDMSDIQRRAPQKFAGGKKPQADEEDDNWGDTGALLD